MLSKIVVFASPWLNFIFCLSVIFIIYFIWMKQKFTYWKKKGVYSPTPSIPFGNLAQSVFQKVAFAEYLYKLCSNNRDKPFIGIYYLHRPVLIVNDPELTKNVFQKDYSSFQGHGFKTDKRSDPLSQHIFNLEGEEWKKMRVKMTPPFTPSKMKYMFETMEACSKDMLEFAKKEVSTEGELEIKEVLAKYSTDVIGSCAFGIEMNSFKHPDAEFRKMGKRLIKPGKLQNMVYLPAIIWPKVIEALKLSINDQIVTKFFIETVANTIKYRQENNIVRNDFLQILIDMKNEDDLRGDGLTMTELTAQVFAFFLAGYETSALTASYTLLELGLNPDIQEKLRLEIERVLNETDGEVTYDALQKMTYLTQVINEALRKYPVATMLIRFCSANYMIPGTNVLIEKGTTVIVPLLPLHRNPEVYPDPMKFDPGRFTPENVASRHPYYHIPFGEGPRICIGSRFGIQQTKLSIMTIIRSFQVRVSEKTKLPIVTDPTAFPIALHTLGGIHLKLAKIN